MVVVSYEEGRRAMKVIVKDDRLYPNPANPSQTIAVGSAAWYSWLAEYDRFIYEGENRRFTARQEALRGGAYWYGYRRRNGKLRKVYLGKASDLTLDKLIAADLKIKEREETKAASPQTSPPDLGISH
jgi:LuxR family maltose regulon positive regulatory protein